MRKTYRIIGSDFYHVVDRTETPGLDGGCFYYRTKQELLNSLTTYGRACLKLAF